MFSKTRFSICLLALSFTISSVNLDAQERVADDVVAPAPILKPVAVEVSGYCSARTNGSVIARYQIEPENVYPTGTSNGGERWTFSVENLAPYSAATGSENHLLSVRIEGIELGGQFSGQSVTQREFRLSDGIFHPYPPAPVVNIAYAYQASSGNEFLVDDINFIYTETLGQYNGEEVIFLCNVFLQ